MKLFIVGEGRNELGEWGNNAPYAPSGVSHRNQGFIVAVLEQIRKDGWSIEGGLAWKSLRKLKLGPEGRGDDRNIARLCLHAEEAGCEVVVFLRDRDGDMTREQDILQAVNIAQQSSGLRIVGGVPIENLESWLLAVLGVAKTQTTRNVRTLSLLKQDGMETKSTEGIVKWVRYHGLSKIPPDATAFTLWLNELRELLGVPE
jgi:hypothetical protein